MDPDDGSADPIEEIMSHFSSNTADPIEETTMSHHHHTTNNGNNNTSHPNGDPPTYSTDDEKYNARHNDRPDRRASAERRGASAKNKKAARSNPSWSDSLELYDDSDGNDDEETCLRSLSTLDTKTFRRLRENRRDAKGSTSGGNKGSGGNNNRGKGGKTSDTETTRNNGNNRGKSSKGWFGGKSSKGSDTNHSSDTEITSNSHNRFDEPSSSNNNGTSSSRRRHNTRATSGQSSQASNFSSHQSSQASNSQYSGTTASSGSVTPLNSNIRSSRHSRRTKISRGSLLSRCYLPWQLLLLSSLGFVTMVRLGFIDFRLEGNQLKQLRFLRGAQDYLPGRNGDDGTTLETHFETHEEDFGTPNIGDSSEWGIAAERVEKEKLDKLESALDALEALDAVEGITNGGGIEYSKTNLPPSGGGVQKPVRDYGMTAPLGIGGGHGGASQQYGQQYGAVGGSQQYGAAPVGGIEHSNGRVVPGDVGGFGAAPAPVGISSREYGGSSQQYNPLSGSQQYGAAAAPPPPSLPSVGSDYSNAIVPPPDGGGVVQEEYGGGINQEGYGAIPAGGSQEQYGAAVPATPQGGVVQGAYGGAADQQYGNGAAVPAPVGIDGGYGGQQYGAVGGTQQYGAVGGNAPISIVQSPEYSNAILPPNGGVVPGDVGGFGAAPAPVGTAGGEYGNQQPNAYGVAPVLQGDAGGFGGAPPASGFVVGEEYGGGTQQYGQQYGAVGGNAPIAIVQSPEYSNAILPPNGGVVPGDVGGFGAAPAPVGTAGGEYGSQQYNAQAGSEQYGAAPVIQGDAGGFGGAPPA